MRNVADLRKQLIEQMEAIRYVPPKPIHNPKWLVKFTFNYETEVLMEANRLFITADKADEFILELRQIALRLDIGLFANRINAITGEYVKQAKRGY